MTDFTLASALFYQLFFITGGLILAFIFYRVFDFVLDVIRSIFNRSK